jgi:aminoglycoside 6-adenylyltransferase
VAKGLAREEIIYAKEMLDLHLRPVFMKMTDWYIGSKNSFSVSTGKGGKFLERFLTKKMYDKVLSTYAGVDIEENWQALFKMTRLFSRFAVETAAVLGFVYKIDEQKASMKYLNKLYKDK